MDTGVTPDAVISGFHMKKNGYKEDDFNDVRQIAENMKAIMENQLVYVHSGDEIIF